MNGVQSVEIVKAPPYPGLIGRDDDLVASAIEPGYGFQAAGYGLPFVDLGHVVSQLDVDDPVPVEDDERHDQPCRREMSAVSRNSDPT